MKRKKWLLPASLAVAVLAAAAMLLAVFYVPDENIEVVGNTRYKDSEIREIAIPGFIHRNTLYLKLFRKSVKAEDVPFVNSIDIDYVARDQIRLHVNEKYPIGYVLQDGYRFYFDSVGLVIESLDDETADITDNAGDSEASVTAETDAKASSRGESEKKDEAQALTAEPVSTADTAFRPAVTDVSRVTGLTEERVTLGQMIPVEDPAVFQRLLILNRLISKFEIPPDSIDVAPDLSLTLWYNKAQISLGSEQMLEEKMTKAAAILPQIRGMAGVLHLETYAEDTVNILFEQTP